MLWQIKVDCTVKDAKGQEFNAVAHLFQHAYHPHVTFYYGILDLACSKSYWEQISTTGIECKSLTVSFSEWSHTDFRIIRASQMSWDTQSEVCHIMVFAVSGVELDNWVQC